MTVSAVMYGGPWSWIKPWKIPAILNCICFAEWLIWKNCVSFLTNKTRELWLIANFKLYLRKFRLWITLPNGWQNHKILSCLWTQRKKEGKNSYLSMSAFWLAQTLISFQCKWHVTEAADGISWLSCVPREPYVLLVQNVPRVKAWSHSVARV